MTTGSTALVQKDKSKGNVAITCLPIMWKLLTGIISERLYNYLEETDRKAVEGSTEAPKINC